MSKYFCFSFFFQWQMKITDFTLSFLRYFRVFSYTYIFTLSKGMLTLARLGIYTSTRHTYHLSTSFDEEPSEPKRVTRGDVAMRKLLIGSQVFCHRVRATHRENPATAKTSCLVWKDVEAIFFYRGQTSKSNICVSCDWRQHSGGNLNIFNRQNKWAKVAVSEAAALNPEHQRFQSSELSEREAAVTASAAVPNVKKFTRRWQKRRREK